ncbi:MAG: polysaccharide deacetylase family protein [Ruminococcus sp.]|nr:polysaccharide deacetylase family protein [Ruminococcus sp.]
MYHCYSPGRFLRLLVLDAVIFSVCALCFLVGKTVMTFAGSISGQPVRLPVIMYHSVGGNVPSEYVVTPVQLEDDLRWLKDHGYTSVTARQICSYAGGHGSLPDKPVLITLDDGFYSSLSVLLPLLEKYDMYAVVSVVGKYTEVNAAADPHNTLYSYLTWEDILELAESGRVEIGNHTYDMHSLSPRRGCSQTAGESDEDYTASFREDTAAMQYALHEHTGMMPFVFAYPFGSVSPAGLPVLREEGILMTLTCREQVNTLTRDPGCLYGIGRINRSGLLSTEEYMSKIEE